MGFIQIWNLNNELTQITQKEQEALDQVARAAIELEESKTSLAAGKKL